jgi:hypothetical protein
MLKVVVFLAALICVCCQLSPVEQQVVETIRLCGVSVTERNPEDNSWTYHFNLNKAIFLVKQAQVQVYQTNLLSEYLFTWTGIGQTDSVTITPPEFNSSMVITATFLLTDDSLFCVSIVFLSEQCPRAVYGSPCSKRPSLKPPTSCLVNGGPTTDTAKCVVGDEPASDWMCINGDCVHNSVDGSCSNNIRARPIVPTSVSSKGAVQLGFRLTDCTGSLLDSITSEQLGVFEQDNKLSPIDTKQQLQRINGHNYVQLMVSMCPRTTPLLNDLITALHLFKKQLNFDNTYVALSVFDGARGFVDIAHFTNSYNTISYAIDRLRSYTVRDDSCNMFEAVNLKFRQFSSFKFGQPWDRTTFVVFSASSDLVGFASGFDIGLPISEEVQSYFIGVDMSARDSNLLNVFFDYTGITSDANAIINAFVDLARVVGLSSDYLFGYCSPSRQGSVSARLDWVFPDNAGSKSLYYLDYDASFFGSCTVNMDYCSACNTPQIERNTIICPNCFDSPTQTIVPPTSTNVQALLRCPNNGGNDCSLSLVNVTGTFNVYIRKNALSNPLLYDNKFTGVEVVEMPLYLPFISAGDLVGVFIEWNEATAFDSKITLIPTAATPDSAPVESPYADAPYSWVDPDNPVATDVPISASSKLFFGALTTIYGVILFVACLV